MKTLLTLILLFIFISTTTFAQDQKAPLALVGGGNIPEDAVSWIKSKTNEKKFVVITCYPEDSIPKWGKHFTHLEAILPENAHEINLDEIAGLIIEGGNQWNYVSRLNAKFIEKAYRSGKPIIATSAGAQILGKFCFTAQHGGITSEEAEADTESPKLDLINFLTIESLDACIVDTHFKERGRMARLKVFMKKTGAPKGIGIDESTALCIDGEKKEVFGVGSVTLLTDSSTEVLVPKSQELIAQKDEIRSDSSQSK